MLQGSSTRMAGLRLIPQSIGVSIGSLGAGAIMSLTGRYYLLGICAMFILNLGTGVFCTFGIQTAQWPQLICLLLLGAGFSSTMSIGLIALIAGVDHPQQAIATSAVYLFRSTGATIGAAVGSAVFQATLRKGLTRRLGDGGTADEIIETILKNFEEVFKVDPQYRDLVVDSYMEALRSVFCTAFVMGAIGMLCIAMVREHKLYKTLDRR
jgi:MFS family permease